MNGSSRASTTLALAAVAAVLLSCGGDGGGGGLCALPGAAAGTPGAYHITLRYLTGTPAQEGAFQAAAARIEELVTSRPSSLQLHWTSTAREWCGVTDAQVPESETVDGLVIFVSVEDLGMSGILAESGPCLLRGTSHLPAAAVMIFNSQYLDGLTAENLDKTVLHEMLHALGFGTLWRPTRSGSGCDLLSRAGRPGASFTGDQALHAAAEENDAPPSWSTVPVEDCVAHPLGFCGAGTENVHWRWAAFHDAATTELMTGWISDGPQPLSATTVASLRDIGYSVDLTKADPYEIPMAAASSPQALAAAPSRGLWLGNDVRLAAPGEIPEP